MHGSESFRAHKDCQATALSTLIRATMNSTGPDYSAELQAARIVAVQIHQVLAASSSANAYQFLRMPSSIYQFVTHRDAVRRPL